MFFDMPTHKTQHHLSAPFGSGRRLHQLNHNPTSLVSSVPLFPRMTTGKPVRAYLRYKPGLIVN